MILFCFNYLLKALSPKSIALEVKNSTPEFEDVTIQLLAGVLRSRHSSSMSCHYEFWFALDFPTPCPFSFSRQQPCL